MKVAHVITRMIVGGAQQNTLDSALGLQALGDYSVTLFTGPEKGPEGNLLQMACIGDLPLRIVPSLKRNLHPFSDGLAFLQLLRAFRRGGFDIVHTHSSKAGILGRWAAKCAGVPCVIHTVHGFSMGPYQDGLRNRLFAALERITARITDTLVFVGESLMQEAKALGLRPRRILCIPSGFDLRVFQAALPGREAMRKKLGVGPGDVLAVKIARFFELKGHAELFEALELALPRDHRLKMLLIGSGPLLAEYKRRVQQKNWQERVLFTGLLPPAEVANHVAAADMLIHTSLREGLARSIPQAFACALPVISSDIPGASDLVKDGHTGYLIALNAPAKLAEVMCRLAGDPTLRRRLGQAGHALVRERYSLERMIAALDKLYKEA